MNETADGRYTTDNVRREGIKEWELRDCTLSRVKLIARARGITGISGLSKNQIIDLILGIYTPSVKLSSLGGWDQIERKIDWSRVYEGRLKGTYTQKELVDICERAGLSCSKSATKKRLAEMLFEMKRERVAMSEQIEQQREDYGSIDISAFPIDIFSMIIKQLIRSDYNSYRALFYVNKKFLNICRYMQELPG